MAKFRVYRVATLVVAFFVSACTTLVAPYDATFDTSLNKLSEDTAKFLAAASAGGAARAETVGRSKRSRKRRRRTILALIIAIYLL